MIISRQLLSAFSLNLALASAAPSASSSKACQDISKAIPGRVSFPLTLDYATESSEYWSTVLRDIKPACVVTAKSASDVSSAVKILNKYPDIKFTAKSGGHDPNPGHATVRDGVLISLNELAGTTYDRAKQVAYIKPGGEWNDVASTLGKEGVAVVGGRLGLVGVGGYLLQGGISFLSAQYGLAADSIIGWEMVTANGTIVNINANTEPDLAVALRGSGSQFGIATQFTVKTYSIGNVWGGMRIYDESKTDDIYKALHEFIPYNNLDPKAAIIVTSIVAVGSSKAFIVFYFYDGEEPPTSGPFADFLKIKSLIAITKKQTYAELTTTIPYIAANPAVYDEISTKLRDITKDYFKNPLNLASQCSVDFQPLPAAIGKATEKRGGNAIGFTGSDPDRILLELQCAWTDKKYDEVMPQFSKDLTSWIEDKVPEWLEKYGEPSDTYLPLFMNDAMADQNVTGSYKDYAKFKALQLEHDPEGVLRTRTGGFKY
ncbi:hypothetical protein ACHAPJ_012056 [Fusarium lateritium]